MAEFYKEHSKVLVSVDCIIFGFDGNGLNILIGKRRMEPGLGQWSLYGGFVRCEESLDEAANRVLYDLTGLESIYMKQVGAFGRVDRDPGERVVSVAYYALICVDDYSPKMLRKHGVKWVRIDQLPQLYSDHNTMVAKAYAMMRDTISREPISFNLLPKLFTLTQLQRLYESVCGAEVDKRNFRKRVKEMDFIEKTDKVDKTGSKRGASLYWFNESMYNEAPNFKL